LLQRYQKMLVTGLCLLGLSLPLLAQPDEDPEAGLSTKQIRALRAIRNRYQGRLQDLQMRLESRRLELAQILQQEEVEKAAVVSKLDEIMNLERERQHLAVEQIFECKGQLSAAQWGPYKRKVLGYILNQRRRGGQFPRRGSDLSSP